MAQKIRQEQILNILEKQGYVTVRYLSEILQYSSATINRDLNSMQTAGLVKRSYGGVEISKRSHLPPLSQRFFYHKKEKRSIAKEAAKQIQNGNTVFLDGSTTVQYMLPFLLEKKDLTIITNNLRLAIELGNTSFKVICLGGSVVERPHVLDGEETVENAQKYHPDKMFLSVANVTADGSISKSFYLLYKTMLKNSAEAWLLTDQTKLTDRLHTSLCDFSRLTGVISDFEFPNATQESFPKVKFITPMIEEE